MDELLNMEGTRIPDTAQTFGRNKTIWQPSDRIRITFEQHPYDIGAPDSHVKPHWHIDLPGSPHQRFLPGEPIPWGY